MKKRFSELYRPIRNKFELEAKTILIRHITNTDKRCLINDLADHYCREFDYLCMRADIPERMTEQGRKWLHLLACKLHPKSA